MNNSLLAKGAKKLLPERLKREIKLACGAPDTEACLANLKRCGFSPKVAIDVGAYSGEWTRTFLRLFPGTGVLMIEPQEVRKSELETMASSIPGLEFASVLLGSEAVDRVGFYESETASSVLPDANNSHHPPSRFLPATTLDILTRQTEFSAPDLIKLDVQGYEIEVLKGAERTLESAEVVLMEVNLIPIYKNAPLLHEAVHHMADRGFRCHDVGTFFRRPYDNSLWQMDMLFVRSSSSLLASTRWS